MRRILKSVQFLDAAISEIRANMPPDPLAGLTDKQRAMVRRYRDSTDAVDQYINCIEGTGPLAALSVGGRITANCTDAEAQDAYQKLLDVRPATRKKLK